MDVRRLPKNATVGFERVPNGAIFDQTLTLAAVGLLARLLACRVEFASFEEVADYFTPPLAEGEKRPRGQGRDAYLAAAKLLEVAGYVRRISESKGRGAFSTKIEVSAMPDFLESAKPQVGFDDGSGVVDATCGNGASTQVKFEAASDGVDMTSGNGASMHVVSTTAKASSNATSRNGVLPQVTSTTPKAVSYLQTVPDSDSPSAPARPGASKAEKGEVLSVDTTPDASALVAALPDNLQPGRGGRPELVAAIATLLALSWPAETLRAKLTQHTLPDRVHNLARLMITWLPEAEPYRAPHGRDSPASEPAPKCSKCNADRRIEDGDGNRVPCPTCHPNREATP
jgi:hypothetical protein